MNRLLRRSLDLFLPDSVISKRVQPAFDRIQSRAQVRQENWMRRRQADLDGLMTAVDNIRGKAVGFLTDWVETKGAVTLAKSTYEVRPNGRGWKVVEKGSAKNTMKTFAKKQLAVKEGKRLAQARHGELKVFSRQNQMQEHLTFSPA